jgi:hypothetical protein
MNVLLCGLCQWTCLVFWLQLACLLERLLQRLLAYWKQAVFGPSYELSSWLHVEGSLDWVVLMELEASSSGELIN